MEKKDMRLLFSLTRNDFEVQTFCTGGNGGQHRNAKQNGVRIIHRASGARAEHRDGRDQVSNKKRAFEKMAETPQFRTWHAAEVARRLIDYNYEDEVNRRVDEMMQPSNLRIEEY